MLYAYNKWTKQPFPAPTALAGGGLALIALVFAWLTLTETPDHDRHPVPAEMQTAAPPRAMAPAIAQIAPAKLVYRNSVIPGGVHSAAELALALQNDPVASAHYAGFNVAAAHVVRVERSRLVHVSYRIGDKIYWTKNKVRLAVGEQLLSDGQHLVRARCGNRIADAVAGATLDREPAPEVLDALMLSGDDLVDHTPYLPTVSHAGAQAAVSVSHPLAARAAPSMPSMPGMMPWPLVAQLNPSALPRIAPPAKVTPADVAPQPKPAGIPGGTGGVPPTDIATPPSIPTPVPDIAPPPSTPTPVPGIATPPSIPTPVPDITPPPSIPTPTPGSPAHFPLGPTAGPQPQAPTDAPPSPTQVPEPGSASLAVAALAILALVRRRAPRRR